MENRKNLTDEELKKIIVNQLDESGIDPEQIKIGVAKGPRIVLKGEVYSKNIQRMIKQVIIETVGINDIVDRLIVIRPEGGTFEEDVYDINDDGFSDDDEDDDAFVGTEDISRSIEDGVPYIPPTESPMKGRRWQRRKF